MSKHLNALILGVGLAMMAVPVMAMGQDARVETTSVPAIIENLHSIDTALAANDPRLAALSEKDKQDLAKHKEKVRSLLSGKQTLDELQSRDRIAAFNSLEAIHGIVSGNREDRVICRREHKLGSNRPQTNCMTAKEREEARNAAVQAMAVRGKMLRQEGM